jgi:DNA polymerase-4
VDPGGERKSIGAETTFDTDLSDQAALEAILADLSAKVGRRARAAGVAGRVVTLKTKTARFRTLTRRTSLSEPTATGHVVLEAARHLLSGVVRDAPFRLIGVSLSELSGIGGADLGDLLNPTAPRRAALERALDQVGARFGAGTVRTLKT